MRDASIVRPLKGTLRRLRRLAAGYRPVPDLPPFPPVPATEVRLITGPANFAGQAWAWGRAAERELPDAGIVVFQLTRENLRFPADYEVPRPVYAHPYWQRLQQDYVTRHFSHVLIDAMRPILGPRGREDCADELPVLRRAGTRVALVAHGSEVRLPSRHAERERWSPFHEWDDLADRLERQARRLGGIINDYDGPTFVSTPDLLIDVPAATWLPVVVDPDRWAAPPPPAERDRLVVLHVPSNTRFKGSHHVDGAMEPLVRSGLVEYRRLEGLAPGDMPAAVADADVVLEQFVLGPYSVTACEAMAAGRTVVAYVSEQVRSHVTSTTGRELPVVQAEPDDLTEVVAGLAEDRAALRDRGEAGRGFVGEVHDGRFSAEVLGRWLHGR